LRISNDSTWRRRLGRQVGVNPFARLRRRGHLERQSSGQQFEQRHTQRIQVAAGVDRKAGAPAVLGRHVGRRAADHPRHVRRRRRGVHGLGGDAEAGQAAAAGGVDDEVARLDVAVHQPRLVRGAQRRRHADRQTQEAADVERARR
jgi:hypothetical protein